MRVSCNYIFKLGDFLPVEIADNVPMLRFFAAVYEHTLIAAAYVNAVPLPYINKMNTQFIIGRSINCTSDAVPYDKGNQHRKADNYRCNSA